MKTITAREIYKNDKLCIRQRLVVDENENVVDAYISIRKVKDGKVVKGKAGIVQLENLTMKNEHHTDKLTNLFLSRNYNYLTSYIHQDQNGVYTLGKPVEVTDENMKKLKADGTPHETNKDNELRYVNQISTFHGSLGKAISVLTTDGVIKIARNTYNKEFKKNPDVLFPKNLVCITEILKRCDSAVNRNKKAKTIKNIKENSTNNLDGREGR